jgi:hypothetical protein
MPWTDYLKKVNYDKLGSVAAAAAKSRAEGRLAEANYGLDRDTVGARTAATNTELDSTRMKQATLLSLLGGAQDAKVTPPAHIASRMPTMTGGFRPSAIQGREEIVASMRKRILESLLTGQHTPPTTPEPQSGRGDKVLSGIGTGSGILGGVKEAGLLAGLGGGTAAAGAGGAAGGIGGGFASAIPIAAAPGALSIGGGAAAAGAGAGAAGGGAGGAAGAAGGVGIGVAGAATLGIGAAVAAAIIAWQKNRNSTKNARDDFAKNLGLGDTERLYARLQALGPEGQRLANIGLNVIGKKDDAANKQWMTDVGTLFDKSGTRSKLGMVRG